MKRALWAAMLAITLGATPGCGILDTVLFGRPGCGGCGSMGCAPCPTSDCGCDDGCGEACGGACGGCCHNCPLIEIVQGLNPDRLLCIQEYREGGCGSCGYGCGERYWGDFYKGDRAGCESCDCHGNWTGPKHGQYSPRSSRVTDDGEPTPAQDDAPMEAAPPKVNPGPKPSHDVPDETQSRNSLRRGPSSSVAKVTKSKKPVTHLRSVEDEPQWTARRGQ